MPLPLFAIPFLTKAGSFIKQFWPYLLVAAALFGVFLYWQGLQNEIKNLNAEITRKNTEIAVLQTRLSTCEANFTGVKGAIDTQNTAIGKVGKLVEKNQKDWKALVGKINSSNDELSKRLAEILKESKPETCEAAIKYLIDARKGYSK